MDSVTHEMAHATGPKLGRWSIDQQPNLSNIDDGNVMAYAAEEFVAITTALKLYGEQLGISNEESSQIRSGGIATVIEQLKLSPEMLSQIDWAYIEACSQEIVEFLQPPVMA